MTSIVAATTNPKIMRINKLASTTICTSSCVHSSESVLYIASYHWHRKHFFCFSIGIENTSFNSLLSTRILIILTFRGDVVFVEPDDIVVRDVVIS